MIENLDPVSANSPPVLPRRVWLVALTLTLALLLLNLPDLPRLDEVSSYRVVLDLAYRPSTAETRPFLTLDGPLAPLQFPIYTGRSIWRSLIWQGIANLFIAGIVTVSAFRLKGSQAGWAIALFAALAVADPAVGPWITLFLLAGWAADHPNRYFRIACGIGIGILASISIPHLLLGLGAMLCQWRRSTTARFPDPYAAVGFLGALVSTWVVLGQSFLRLAVWIWFGLTGGWTPSAVFLTSTTNATAGWAVLAAFGAILLAGGRGSPRRSNGTEWPAPALILWGMLLSWKLVALQPAGSPLLFFTTVVFGGFVFQSVVPKRALVILLVGLGGIALTDKMAIGDAVGRTNRRLLQNVSDLSQLPGLRDRLRQTFSAMSKGVAMPEAKAVTAGMPVGIVGDHAAQTVLNEFRLAPSPIFGAGDLPPYLLHRVDRTGDLLPGLQHGPARLELYRDYEFVLTETGISLWKRKGQPPGEAPKLIAEGTLHFGENLPLPASNEAYWLEILCSPNPAGLIADQFRPLPEPSLRLVDEKGLQLRYTLPWRMASRGFLAQPFFRGDTDLLRFQEGESLPRLNRVVVEPPSSARWAWSETVRYRLYRFPRLESAHIAKLTDSLSRQFAAIPRLPLSVSAPFTPASGEIDAKPAIFMHPDSSLEIAIGPEERIIQGSFGIAPGAYAEPGGTDGVSFSLELVPATGPRQVLLKRHLDPVAHLEDRGPQSFTITLPSSQGGRLLLRTFNLPYGTGSFDWSYWRQIELK
jgi:hypothetical protein